MTVENGSDNFEASKWKRSWCPWKPEEYYVDYVVEVLKFYCNKAVIKQYSRLDRVLNGF